MDPGRAICLRAFLGYFGAGLSGFAQGDGNGLLAALYLPAFARLQFPAFILPHDLSDFFLVLSFSLHSQFPSCNIRTRIGASLLEMSRRGVNQSGLGNSG